VTLSSHWLARLKDETFVAVQFVSRYPFAMCDVVSLIWLVVLIRLFVQINNHDECVAFYPRDAVLARVFATATCLSVCHTPVLCLAERKEDREMYTI